MAAATPLFRQYEAIKAAYPGCILMFRLGDFYEMFGEDAEVASSVLEIVLTSREKGEGERIPMCGVPYHALEGYLQKLVEAGHRVAVCDQIEGDGEARGVMRREVTRVVTPGTLVEGSLGRKESHFLTAIHREGRGRAARFGLASLDVSTGDFRTTELEGEGAEAALLEELARLEPAECLIHPSLEGHPALAVLFDGRPGVLSVLEERAFRPEPARRRLLEHFGIPSLDAFGCEDRPAAVAAAGAALQYAQETQKVELSHVTGLVTYQVGAGLILDRESRRSLELVHNLRDGGRRGTLLEVLDGTVTAMGGRLLRQWLLEPLRDPQAIEARLAAVEALVEAPDLLHDLRAQLDGVQDLERLAGRIAYGTANGRDLVGLARSLERLPRIWDLAAHLPGPPPAAASGAPGPGPGDRLEALREAIQAELVDDPPVTVREGGLIRPGFSAEVDRLRELKAGGRRFIQDLEQRERERTGIKSLKVGFNKVFGYYIEVTRANLAQVPPDYRRRQTLSGAERFVTPELKEQESQVLGAEERLVELEYRLFTELREHVAQEVAAVQAAARRVAWLDVVGALAGAARQRGYVRPRITGGGRIWIEAGRHPVVEATPDQEPFVPNDCELDAGRRLLIITGPNMAGKSTYLRQVALIVLMAQMGSFVPARSAEIGVVDRIFTRVGASDDLAGGRSTFMVEMTEAARIARLATEQSLVVVDELGRGTSTYDGLALAQAFAEYLHDHIRCRTLMSTHYHELTHLEGRLPAARNLHVEVREERGNVIFLRQVRPGGTDRSYGVNVARMAGLPPEIVHRARQLLRHLSSHAPDTRVEQLGFFEAAAGQGGAAELDEHALAALRRLEELQVEAMTPLEALQELDRLKRLALRGRKP
ncbi:DNA mismatch repair protein MutS [Limnochorda pilosa]|uniref:DNA mismatch repair protein MutS n=1 Tax=Limnochorda pilosa TaxID=1555112 RepID=A0A0K2SL52_LIMPI|nr:DNA mismatch repair protein MutS [Limnochorda pilosa]BAS27574.1 DNA mismatch repair protein MutS [Limnochorda pilosa]